MNSPIWASGTLNPLSASSLSSSSPSMKGRFDLILCIPAHLQYPPLPCLFQHPSSRDSRSICHMVQNFPLAFPLSSSSLVLSSLLLFPEFFTLRILPLTRSPHLTGLLIPAHHAPDFSYDSSPFHLCGPHALSLFDLGVFKHVTLVYPASQPPLHGPIISHCAISLLTQLRTHHHHKTVPQACLLPCNSVLLI